MSEDSSTDDGGAHCPHCGAHLPEPDGAGSANFCPTCGRRVAGWRTGVRAQLGGATAGGEPLASAEEPTRAIPPTPSLIEAMAKAKARRPRREPTKTDNVVPLSHDEPRLLHAGRRNGAPLLIGAALLGGGVVAAFMMLFRPERPPVALAPPPPVEAPVAASRPPQLGPPAPVTVTPPPVPPVIDSEPVAAPKPEATKPAHAEATTKPEATKPAHAEATPKPEATKPAHAEATPKPTHAEVTPKPTHAEAMKPHPAKGGGLPHKHAATDSRPETGPAPLVAAPSGTSPPPATAPDPSPPQPSVPDERARAAEADGVRFVVQAHIAQVQTCYSRAFKDRTPGGRVDIGFVIGASGRASRIRIERNTMNEPALARCLEQRIADWEFPRPVGGDFELIYPFIFSQGS